MPALLYGIGAFALFAGLVMIGFGIPINEFSFGNTLISAGTTAVVGGLILFGLGVVAGQLRRVAEALAADLPSRVPQASETHESDASARALAPHGRTAFAQRPKPETSAELSGPSPARAGLPLESVEPVLTPMLRNPALESAAHEDDVSLSPRQPLAPAAPTSGGPGLSDRNREHDWRSPAASAPAAPSPPVRPLHNPNFDAMWPADAKVPKGPPVSEPEAKPAQAPPPPKRVEAEKPRAAAILKSGVVDGMGYTLYVDGSIEAELPQGTLRFASINELRSHIAKNS